MEKLKRKEDMKREERNGSKNVSNAKESKPTKNACKNSTNTCPPCPSIMICLALDRVNI